MSIGGFYQFTPRLARPSRGARQEAIDDAVAEMTRCISSFTASTTVHLCAAGFDKERKGGGKEERKTRHEETTNCAQTHVFLSSSCLLSCAFGRVRVARRIKRHDFVNHLHVTRAVSACLVSSLVSRFPRCACT